MACWYISILAWQSFPFNVFFMPDLLNIISSLNIDVRTQNNAFLPRCEPYTTGVNKLFTPDALTTHRICSGRSSFFNRHQTSIIPSQKCDIVNLCEPSLSRCERQIKGVNKLFTVDACRPLTKHALELCSPPSASKELY